MRTHRLAIALLLGLALTGSACWLRGLFSVTIIVEGIGEEVDEIIDTVFSGSTAAVCNQNPFSGIYECTYIVGGEVLCSTAYILSEFGLLGALVDPLVLQLPEGVTEASGTYDDGSGAAPLVVTQTASFAVEPGVEVTAEPGHTFLILELPLEVAASLPEGPPDQAGSDLDFTFHFRLPGDQPLRVKGMATVRLDVAGQTFYVPVLPCTTDFAEVPEIEIPAPVQDFDLLAAIAAAIDGSMVCAGFFHDYSNLDLDLDHRLLYRAPRGTRLAAQVAVEDASGVAAFEVSKAAALGTPADRDLFYPGAPASPEHLTGYAVRSAAGGGKPAKQRLRTSNRYGLQTVELGKRDLLLLPAAASLAGPPAPLADPEVAAFACDRARAAKGEPGLARGTSAFVSDAHGSAVYELRKPSRLCRPVDVDGSDPGAFEDPAELLCFKAKPARRVCQNAPRTACRQDSDCGGPCIAQPKPPVVDGIDVADALGGRRLGALQAKEICVPSTTAPALERRAPAGRSATRRAGDVLQRLLPRGKGSCGEPFPSEGAAGASAPAS